MKTLFDHKSETDRTVADFYGISVKQIRKRCSRRANCEYRHISIYIQILLYGTSMPKLAKHYGYKNHASSFHAKRKIENLIASDTCFRNEIDKLIQYMNSKVRVEKNKQSDKIYELLCRGCINKEHRIMSRVLCRAKDCWITLDDKLICIKRRTNE